MVLKIGVIGVGSIGSVLASGFNQLGHSIVIHDVDTERTGALPYATKQPAKMGEECDLIVITVPTPTTDSGGDASVVGSVLNELDNPAATVCIRSTMPPGATARLAEETGIPLVYSPEFLRDRSDVEDFFDPDRIVLAGPAEERQTVREALNHNAIDCDTVLEFDDYLTAELGKEAHNAFFATKVSFANQIRLVSEAVGADPTGVVDIITADHRNTNSHLDPMLGPYGGKCLPKDTKALTIYADRHDVPTPLLSGVIDTNAEARRRYDNIDIEGNWPNLSVKGD